MLTSDHLEEYLGLLHIRRAAMRRDSIITGGSFLVVVLAAVAFGLLGGISGRSAYIVWPTVMTIGFGFLITRVRLEIVKAQMELLDRLQREAN